MKAWRSVAGTILSMFPRRKCAFDRPSCERRESKTRGIAAAGSTRRSSSGGIPLQDAATASPAGSMRRDDSAMAARDWPLNSAAVVVCMPRLWHRLATCMAKIESPPSCMKELSRPMPCGGRPSTDDQTDCSNRSPAPAGGVRGAVIRTFRAAFAEDRFFAFSHTRIAIQYTPVLKGWSTKFI